jgi:hypothetical protein
LLHHVIRLSTERVFCVIRIVGFAEGMRAVYTKGMVGGEENAVQLPRGADVLANNDEGKRETREEDVLRLVKWSSLFKRVSPRTDGPVPDSHLLLHDETR